MEQLALGYTAKQSQTPEMALVMPSCGLLLQGLA